MTRATATADGTLFPPREAELYVERTPLGLPGPAFQGASFFTAPNPPFGAVFTYLLKDELKSLRKQRWAEEAKIEKDGGNEPSKGEPAKTISIPYPTWEQLRSEQRELDPAVVLVVSDDDGNIIRRVTGPVTSGFHRVAWDLRYPPPSPAELNPEEPDQFDTPIQGPLVTPGTYSVRLTKRIDGVETTIGQPQTFNVVPLYLSSMSDGDRAKTLEFQKRASRLQKAIMGAARANADALTRVQLIRLAIDQIDGPDPKLVGRLNAVDK